MKIELSQKELEIAVRNYLAGNLPFTGKKTTINFVATRVGGRGIVTEILLEDDPDAVKPFQLRADSLVTGTISGGSIAADSIGRAYSGDVALQAGQLTVDADTSKVSGFLSNAVVDAIEQGKVTDDKMAPVEELPKSVPEDVPAEVATETPATAPVQEVEAAPEPEATTSPFTEEVAAAPAEEPAVKHATTTSLFG